MKKLPSALALAAMGLLFAAASMPAIAQVAPPVSVPEPGSLSLLAVGIGGAYLVSRYLRRK